MTALPMKPECGPTLGRLLAPRWHAASPVARVAVTLAGVALVALALATGLTLANATYSHGGPVPFSFSYRGLYRVAPDPGGYVKVQSHWPDGALKYSYAVDPLRLPHYAGSLSGELPVYAAGYIRALRKRYSDLAFSGEGKTRISNSVTGYQIAYSARVAGQEMYVREVLLLPERAGAREGVDVVMLTAPTASAQVTSPREVGATGVLLRPLKTFSFG
jgi:hypothetical protein